MKHEFIELIPLSPKLRISHILALNVIPLPVPSVQSWSLELARRIPMGYKHIHNTVDGELSNVQSEEIVWTVREGSLSSSMIPQSSPA